MQNSMISEQTKNLQFQVKDRVWALSNSKNSMINEKVQNNDYRLIQDTSAGFRKYIIPSGEELPQYKYDKSIEIAYVLSGEGIVSSLQGDQSSETPVNSGCIWYTKPGILHSFKNTGNEPLSLLFATIPYNMRELPVIRRETSYNQSYKTETQLSKEELNKIANEHDFIFHLLIILKSI